MRVPSLTSLNFFLDEAQTLFSVWGKVFLSSLSRPFRLLWRWLRG